MKKKTFAAALIVSAAITCAAQTTGGAHISHVGHEHSACDDDSINPQREAILHEITVQGVTGTQRIKDAAAPFTVVSPQELHALSGTNIVDALSHTPGLAQISTGSGIGKPVIRGLGYNRVVVIDQGIRQEGQQWGDEHGLEVDAMSIHSVEVLKGPASLMYGSDAIAGVMILHPENALDANTMQVRLCGEYQTNARLRDYTVGFAGNKTLGNDGQHFLWNWHYTDKTADEYENRADGKVGNSWFDERSLQGMLGIDGRWGHSWLRLSNVKLTPGIVGEEDAFQRIIHTKVVSDNIFSLGGGTLKAIAGYQRNYRREFEDGEAALAMRLHTVNYDVRYALPEFSRRLKINTGVGGMWQQNVNSGEERLIPDYRLFDFGAFITATQQWDRWHLSGGLRFDTRSTTADPFTEEDEEYITLPKVTTHHSALTASLGAVYNISDKLNARLNIARGFRAPTVSEMYSDGVHEGSVQYELGNMSLSPEYSTQTDIGLDYTSHWLNIQAALFYNRITDYIYLQRLAGVFTDGYRTYQYRQGDASLIGGELSVDVHPTQALHIQNAFSFVSGRLLHQPSDSKWLPMMPAPRWNCNVRYLFPDLANRHLRRARIGAEMEYNLRQDHFFAADDTETATPDYAIFNLSAGIDLHILGHNCIELSLTCQNIFNKVYQNHLSRLKYVDTPDDNGIHAMGRNFCMKVTIPIDIHL